MTQVLRVLMVEDSEDDAILIRETLRNGGYEVHWLCVDGEEPLCRALREGQWDIVLSDFSLPAFSAFGTFAVMQETGNDDIPVIVISGTVGEDVAVQTLQLGAADYLLKQNLTRLVPAVRRALDLAQSRRQQRWLERMKTIILDNSPDLICTFDEAGRFLEVSTASRTMLGYDPAELKGTHFSALAHPEDRARIETEFQAVLQGRPSRNFEKRCLHKSGRIVHLNWSASLSHAEGVVVGVGHDISERRQKDEALRRSAENVRRERARLRALIDSIPDMIFFKNRNFAFLGCNHAFEEYLGISEIDLVGRSDFDLAPAEWARRYREQDERLFASGESQHLEERILGRDGQTRLFDTIKTQIYGMDGETLGLVGLSRDITERKRMEEALREKTALLEAQMESSLDGIVIVDRDGNKLIQNKRLAEVWGLPPELADTQDSEAQLRFVTGRVENPEDFLAQVEWMHQHPEEVGRDVVELIDGTVLERYTAPVTDKEGRHYGRIWSFRDITAEIQRELRLRQAQKMEAIGNFAAGIAHDFNNILAVVQLNADLMAQGVSDPESIRDIQHATRRGRDLIDQILGFAKHQHAPHRLLDLREPVAEAVQLLRGSLPDGVALEHVPPPQPALISGNATQLLRLVLNLGKNAVQAMSGRQPAQLTIALETQVLDKPFAAAHPPLCEGPAVALHVHDTGKGMDEATLARVFEPYFSTKGQAGTGLGLALVHGIVEQHRGVVLVDSTPDAGTTFSVWLPGATPQPGSA